MRFGYFTFAPSDSAVSCVTAVSVTPETSISLRFMVRARGLEPLILAEPDPKSGVSANSTTRATPSSCAARRRISSLLLQRAIARTRRFVYFRTMSFWFRIHFSVMAAGLGLALGGCSPSDQSQLDEEKEPHFVLGNSRVNAMDYQGAIEAFQESLEVN